MPLPQLVRQDDEAFLAVVLFEHAAHAGGHAGDLPDPRRDPSRGHSLGATAQVQVDLDGVVDEAGGLERPGRLGDVQVRWRRDLLDVGAEWPLLPDHPDVHHPIGLRVAVGVEQGRPDHAEDGGVGADADGQSDDDEQRRARMTSDVAQTASEVVQERVEKAQGPLPLKDRLGRGVRKARAITRAFQIKDI
jgi:hypothetical protein